MGSAANIGVRRGPDAGAPGRGWLPSPAGIAAIQAHPGFPAAIKAASAGFVDLYQGNRLLNRLINDRARMVFGMLMLDMHFRGQADGRPGFTVTAAQDLCRRHGVCSPGRTAAMMALMRFGGYIELLPGPGDRRVRLYGVTDRFVAMHHERWRRMFSAIALVRPEGAAALAALAQPAFTPAYIHGLADDFHAGVRVLLDSAPELGLFAERNSGMMILFSLMAEAGADDTCPPSRSLPVSISALARRFGVSRAHVLKLLRDAAAAGFIALTPSSGGHCVTFEPKLSAAVRSFFALVFLYLAGRAGAAVEAIAARG